jgi:hypothetical protein
VETLTYDEEITAVLVIDPYNDFISGGGKLWNRLKAVAEANSCVPHMLQVLNAARKARLCVFYALHRRYRPGDYETWKYIGRFRRQPGCERLSNPARGAARSENSEESNAGSRCGVTQNGRRQSDSRHGDVITNDI